MNRELSEFISNKKPRLSTVNTIYIVVVLYALFALSRIKGIGALVVDGITTNNMVFLIALALGMIVIASFNKNAINKNQIAAFCCLLLLICLGMCFVDNVDQSVYATLVLVLPLGFLLFTKKQTHEEFINAISILALLSMIYSLITIVAAFNYEAIMDMLGNKGEYYERARAALPLGGSITVSYYLNMSLPLLFLLWGEAKKRSGKILYIVAIVLNISATLVQLSRSAVVTCAIILAGEVILQVLSKKGTGKWVLLSVVVLALGFVASKVDLSRLLTNIFDGNTSDQSRFQAVNLGLHIFKKNYLFGTGVGSYFFRAWVDPKLVVDGIKGLIDPHCAFVLILSEVGLIGTIFYGMIFILTIVDILMIRKKDFRVSGLFIVVALLLNSIWGSHLINEVAYSSVAFIYLALFVGYSKNKKNG